MRDRGSQFIDAFDEIFRTEGCKALKTPVRTPVANAFAERWIGTLRRELLDRTVIWNRHQLERLVVDYIDHYNTHRPHRSLDQRPSVATDPPDQPDRQLQVVRTPAVTDSSTSTEMPLDQPRHSFRHPQPLPEPVARVPEDYFALLDSDDAHPGTGLGRSALTRRKDLN